jgi:hypothetical protein
MFIRRFKSEHREKAIWFLLVSAQLSMLLVSILEDLVLPRLPGGFGMDIDFICGFLIGYAIVGNLAFLVCVGKLLKVSNKGVTNL